MTPCWKVRPWSWGVHKICLLHCQQYCAWTSFEVNSLSPIILMGSLGCHVTIYSGVWVICPVQKYSLICCTVGKKSIWLTFVKLNILVLNIYKKRQAWMPWLNILVDIVYIDYSYKDMSSQSLTSVPCPASWWGLQWWSRSPCTASPEHHLIREFAKTNELSEKFPVAPAPILQ